MHTSGDDTDGQDGSNLLDTNEDDNNKTMNNQKSCGLLSAPIGLAMNPACSVAQQKSNYNQDMGDSAVELTEPSETDMDTDLPAHPCPQYIGKKKVRHEHEQHENQQPKHMDRR